MDIIKNFESGKTDIFITAEVGINHNGDINIAKKLIDVCSDSGIDAVKFQKRTIDKVYTSEFLSSERESPWGTTQKDQKEGLEFGEKEYDEINDYCNQLGIQWYASAWDTESQTFLKKYNLKFNKIASAMTTNEEFVKVVADEKKPTFISTGMCTIEEIREAVEIFNKAGCDFVLMHTNSEYPSPEKNLNLRMLETLKKEFNCNVGYSGHESSVSPSIYAVALGAVSIERHVTLDRSMYGSDQSASLEPIGLKNLVNQIRKFNKIYGDGVKKITDVEKEVAKKLRYWED